jgi:glycosyltransferase involved in cell wall biosynthesis
MSVSVVIPVWNDCAGVQSALTELAKAPVITEVIVVDDCSERPVADELDINQSRAAGQEIKVLRHDSNRGGGAARNTGLDAVTQPYVIFLDSDDLPTECYGDILAEFIAFDPHLDFAMFRHIDSREEAKGKYQGLPIDEERWKKLSKGPGPQRMPPEAQAQMAVVSAYPWNKLYRTDFLRKNQVRCTEIPVHNDIEIHWVGFICAENILYSHRTGVKHFVHAKGDRITNRKGEERLRVFSALENVVSRLDDQNAPLDMRIAYWTFFVNLMNWIPANLAEEFQSRLKDTRSSFVFHFLPKAEFRKLAWQDSALTSRLLKLVERNA